MYHRSFLDTLFEFDKMQSGVRIFEERLAEQLDEFIRTGIVSPERKKRFIKHIVNEELQRNKGFLSRYDVGHMPPGEIRRKIEGAIALMDLYMKHQIEKIRAENPEIERSFAGESFEGANLSNAILSCNDYSNANFANADLRGANLSGAILKGAIITGALIDKGTMLPDGKRGDKGRLEDYV